MTKSILSGLFFPLLFSSSVLGNDSVIVKDYQHVSQHLTWQEAQSHCRTIPHTDLATIQQPDADRILIDTYNAWIGYYIPAQWTDKYYIWISEDYTGEDPNDGNCGSVQSSTKSFLYQHCQQYLFFICQHSLVNGLRNYTLVLQSKTWTEALNYCKENFYSLATLKDYTSRNSAVVQKDFPVWIGLYREVSSAGKMWKWSKGSSEYRNWATGEPKNDGDCVTISSITRKMSTQDCRARFPFVCLKENLILVKENKTWQEALEHCRAFNYELVSVQPGEDHRRMMGYIMEAETNKVWTGLRFLAGDWLWMNKATVRYSELPLCPQQGQRCGVLSKEDKGSVEITDCSWKLNFLCYTST
ncbi:secretory phospholipase A2 receptor-like isoform X1 [Takifugu rubripes]|uniref:secretory phospholipase A2 receptor-like isoform X1 n=1 Tax=Takifugu rubripes TaxID=31033 RepID=UPI0005D14BC7|nr:secretory phospholipase A2 receptor-like isoform X1 [Takifugu rubripes]|eukprot:XP_011608138.1 PREDICTED: secretory phospholipase A2 receptor-like isoform X1 [Takifugu rubripes]